MTRCQLTKRGRISPSFTTFLFLWSYLSFFLTTFLSRTTDQAQKNLSLFSMDPLILLGILSLLSLQSKVANGDHSVVFLDSPTRNYLRPPSAETDSLTLSEAGAAASVLLGFAPPSTLSAASSSKLSKVLMPNPFDRPRSVFMIEVTGVEDKSAFSNGLRVKIMGGEDRVDIQLSDEHEVSLVSLNERSSYAEYSDKELSDFASWLGGSYVEDPTGPLNGELIVPLANDALLRLRMSEKADMEFTTSLMFLINNIQRAMEMHKRLSESRNSPAELITGRFDGIKAERKKWNVTRGEHVTILDKEIILGFRGMSHLQNKYSSDNIT